jgi:hypothetical protein
MRPVVFVFTSDKYLKSLHGFSYLFNKYWGDDQKVLAFGFSQPEFSLPSNFEYHSIGKQEDYPINKWSNAIISVLQNTDPAQRPIIMLEDYWITRPVNVDVVNAMWVYMRSTVDVLKLDLMTDRLYSQGMTDYGNVGFIDIIKSDPTSAYQMSWMTGLWNPTLLLKYLIPDETPWDVEIYGTPRVAAEPQTLVLGTRQFPVRHILAHRGGDSSKFMLDGLAQADIFELRKMGVI